MDSEHRSSECKSQGARLLTSEDVKVLVGAAIDGGLFEIARSLYLRDLRREIVHSIPHGDSDLVQFHHDLNFLTDLAASANDGVQLLQFLDNITDQLALRNNPKTKVFKAYCEAVRAKLLVPTDGQSAGNVPFTLAGVIEGIEVNFVPIASGASAGYLFYLSSSPLPIGASQPRSSTGVSKETVRNLLMHLRGVWPTLRPPLIGEAQAAFFSRASSRALPGATGKCLWCLEKSGLVARRYSGEVVDSTCADVWLVYPG